jgi:hypothetical protein
MKPLIVSLDGGGDIRLNLTPRQVIATQPTPGLAVECLTGSVWITIDGGGYDHVLNAGERLSLSGAGRTVIEGLAHSEVLFHCDEIAPVDDASARDLLRYPAECWRAFVARFAAPRCDMQTPF